MSRAGSALRTLTGVVGELLITLGVLLLLFVAWQLWWTDVRAEAAQEQVTDQLQEQWDARAPGGTAPTEPTEPTAAEPPATPAPDEGEPFAVVHVPRFGEGFQPRPVLEGTDQDVLREGVGHYAGTALPGAVGNVALAGHRVTYGKPFNQVAELERGDAVVLETAQAWFTYRVTSWDVVSPSDVDVIAAVPGDPSAQPTERMLTLTTCHPMFSARERYVVHAVLEQWQPRASGEPLALAEAGA